MNILLVGNGGRENALAWKIYNSRSFRETKSKLYNTYGNPGINKFAEAVNIGPSEIDSLIDFVLKEEIEFTVVGPEIPLSNGIVNKFSEKGLKVFGPSKEASEIESSKVFAKKLMFDNGIPTAKYKNFSKNDPEAAKSFLEKCDYPVVIKADGLAAGKGVIIAKDYEDAVNAITDLTGNNSSGDTGFNFIFIIEEFLQGEEVSVFAVTDGEDYVILPYSQDHKKILDGDTGKNTGGMGAVAPAKKFMNEVLEGRIKNRIIDPVLKALSESGREFKGCLYCGLMILNNEPYVIEFNCRFGDPETQAVLPLIESDFLEMLIAASSNGIKNYNLKLNDKYACCVVLASGGYPDEYETGKEISGLIDNKTEKDFLIFHSGTKYSDNGKVVSNGGRVLSVVGISENSLEDAVKNAYTASDEINFDNKYFRHDIGFKLVKG